MNEPFTTVRRLHTDRLADILVEVPGVNQSEALAFLLAASAVTLSIQGSQLGDIENWISGDTIRSLSGGKRILLTGCQSDFNLMLSQITDRSLQTALARALGEKPRTGSNLDRLLPDLGKRTLIMGILNTTPDSFSDGGEIKSQEEAVDRAMQMLAEGADIIDIGGESTKPGAEPVDSTVEAERILPVIRMLRRSSSAIISVDTTKSEVAEAALNAGADIVNDISSGDLDSAMAQTCSRYSCPVILMHMLGDPKTMQSHAQYQNVVGEVYDFLAERLEAFEAAGCKRENLIIDPGFGFSKKPEHNIQLLRRLAEFDSLGCPVLVGVSRKSTLGKYTDSPDPKDRIEGTAAAVAVSVLNGADIVRVHDIKAMAKVVAMADAIARS